MEKTKGEVSVESIEGGYLVRWGGSWSVRIRERAAAFSFASAKGGNSVIDRTTESK